MSKFGIGKMYCTPTALEMIEQAGLHPRTLLDRHQAGDWGDFGYEDKRLNDAALKSQARLPSSCKIGDNAKVWIITEADRTASRRRFCSPTNTDQ